MLYVRLLLDISLLLLSSARLLLAVGVQIQVDVGGDLGCRLFVLRHRRGVFRVVAVGSLREVI